MIRSLGLVLAVAASPAMAHDIYTGWQRPDDPNVSCCDDRDCHPSAMCLLPTGGEGIVVLGACVPVPYDKVLPFGSPDGRPHVCYSIEPVAPIVIHCVALPTGA